MKIGEIAFEHLSPEEQRAYGHGNPVDYENGDRVPVRLTRERTSRGGITFWQTTGVAQMVVGDEEGTVSVDGSDVYLVEEGN